MSVLWSRFVGSRGAPSAKHTELLGTVDRTAKAAVTGAAATLTSLAAHVAAGAPAPGLVAVAAAVALSMLVAIPLSGRAVSLGRLAAVIAAAQALFHLIFMLGTPSAAAQFAMAAVPGHEGHLQLVGDGAGPLLAHGLHLTLPMLAAHVGAGLLTLAALHSGERVVQALAAAARFATRRIRTQIGALIALVCAAIAPLRRPRTASLPVWQLPHLALDGGSRAWSGSRRGPPVRR